MAPPIRRGVVIGPMVPPPTCALAPWVRWEAERLERQYDAMLAGEWEPTARQFYTGERLAAPRSRRWRRAASTTTFKRAEDVEFAYRLADRGMQILLRHRRPSCCHDPGRSFAAWLRVPYEYGRYDVVMARERGRRVAARRRAPRMEEPPPAQSAAATAVRRPPVAHRAWLLGDAWPPSCARPLPGASARLQIALCSPMFASSTGRASPIPDGRIRGDDRRSPRPGVGG